MNKSATVTRDMGIGELGDPNIIFVRKFRWTLESATLKPHLVKNLDIDHLNKKIKFSAYELSKDKKISIHEWLDSIRSNSVKEKLLFKTFDGIGREIYQLKFNGLKLTNLTQNFDYASSDVSALDFELSFRSVYRKNAGIE